MTEGREAGGAAAEAPAAPSGNDNDLYDVVIVGGGPAGLTAGLYCSRARMKAALIERGAPGGMVLNTEVVENYPGFADRPVGRELAAALERHATAFGLELRAFTTVHRVQRTRDIHWLIQHDEGNLHSKGLIVATGASPRKLGVPGENEFAGRGVSYCATCDGAFFKDKRLVVVGGGDSAVEEAVFLTRFASTVTIVHRRDRLRAAPLPQERAFANPKIGFEWNAVVKEIRGGSKVESVLLESTTDGGLSELACDGVFIYVGNSPASAIVSHLVELDEQGYIVTDEAMVTSQPGIFACGDVRKNLFKQIVVATGEGAIAALSAQRWAETHE